MKEINVAGKKIGGDSTFVIAEIGSNHCCSLKTAFETIDAAADAGADAVKFQSIRLDKLYLNPSAETIALHKKIDLPEEWHKDLSDYCKKKSIIFFSSPTYPEAVDILESVGVPLYKLASAQVGTFPQIVQKVAATGKPVILSTGLVTMGELEKTVQIFQAANNLNFIILHCNSIYPVPYDRVHMPTMKTYAAMFDCLVGFSDHTNDIFGSIVAVSQGAKVIEKHFTLSRKLDSPDAPLALEPNELHEMIRGIRATEKMLLPEPRTHLQLEEVAFKNKITTRLILRNSAPAGKILSADDFIFRRDSSGIDCREIDSVLGKRLRIAIKENERLEKNHIEGY